MEKKTIVARAKVLAEKQAAFLNATEALIQGTRAERGNISYTLYQSTENPSDFIFYEEYIHVFRSVEQPKTIRNIQA